MGPSHTAADKTAFKEEKKYLEMEIGAPLNRRLDPFPGIRTESIPSSV